jgi:hypothetical protein
MSSSSSSSGSDNDDRSGGSDKPHTASRSLRAAVRAREIENLRALLSQEDESGHPAINDDDIHEALLVAAQEGSVEACRLLWEKLSRRGKQKYFGKKIEEIGPLHGT